MDKENLEAKVFYWNVGRMKSAIGLEEFGLTRGREHI